MKGLTKIAQILLKGVALVTGGLSVVKQIVPEAGGVVTRLSTEIEQFVNVIVAVEAVGQISGIKGAEKARAAGSLIGQVILASPFMAGKKIKDVELFKQGCANIGGGFADVLNSLNESSVKETSFSG